MNHLRTAPKAYATGRHIDPALGSLTGEGAHQFLRSKAVFQPHPAPLRVQPASHFAQQPLPDYYGRPVLKEPVWIWSVPLYFHVGGIAGASMALAAVLQAKRWRHETLLSRCRWLGLAGATAGSGLLTYDLGRPDRFYNMLRVCRPTSPMSWGSWGLALGSGAMAASLLLSRAEGAAGWAGLAAGYAAGVVGPGLAGYTGVLLGNTAVPLWNESRRLLPVLFTASGMTGAAALLETDPALSPPERRIVRTFGWAGKIAEATAIQATEWRVSRNPAVGRPLKKGRSGLLWKAGKVLTGAGMLLSALPAIEWRPHRKRARTLARAAKLTAPALVTAGAVALRYALFEAGKASARDPQALFRLQHGRKAQTGRSW